MHLLLTDRLQCPRCGPGFGLVLMASTMADRRVTKGHLGCANCRERYPIEDAVADLRPAPRIELMTEGPEAFGEPEPGSAIPPEQFAAGLAAAMGALEGGRPVVLVGGAAAWAMHLRDVLPDEVEVVTAHTSRRDAVPGTSSVIVGDAWPFPEGTLGGVTILGGAASPPRLRALARLLDPRRRLVVIDPPEGIQARLGGAGLTRFVRGPGLAAAGR